MKVSASIELTWQLACREAIAAEFKEIEPEHFLLALLQLAEAPMADLQKLGGNQEVAALMGLEISHLREILAGRKIESGALRRELRSAMGHGSGFSGGQMHRTPACREYFDKAARVASDSGNDTLMPRHLLECLLAAPTPVMAQVLAAFGMAVKAGGSPPLVALYEQGRDLNRLVEGQYLARDRERLTEARVVLRILSLPAANSVFLISEDVEVARKTVFTAVRGLVAGEGPANLKGRRIIDLTRIGEDASREKPADELLERLLKEASQVSGIILFLPTVAPKERKMPSWMESARTLAASGKVQFLAGLSAEMKPVVEEDRNWRKVVHIVQLMQFKSMEIPSAL
jgi:ATP-dependent Clp protease ATP-binding subunit ClpA